MTLDTTKWAAGSDGDLIPQPVVSGTSVALADRYLDITLASGGLLASESDPDLTEIWLARASDGAEKGLPFESIIGLVRRVLPHRENWREQFEARRKIHEPAKGSPVYYNGTTITGTPYLRNLVGAFNVRKLLQDSTYWGALSCDDSLYVFYDNDGDGSHTVEIATPYHWQDVDFAEFVFALTRYYSGGGTAARDLLAEDDLYAYSELMADPLRQVWLSYWREVDVTLAAAIAEVLSESGALARWGISESNQFTFKFSILHYDLLALHSHTLDLGAGINLFLVAPATMRHAGELIRNLVLTLWGSCATSLIDTGSWAGDLHPTWSMQSPANLTNKENELTIEDAPSQALFGTQRTQLTARHVFYEDHASAAAVRFGFWLDGRRIIQWSMGPLHFDFSVGDIVPITHEQFGLSAVQFLIVSKTYRWRTLQADIVAVEIAEDYSLSPDDESVASSLKCWLDGDEGVTLSGSDVTDWADQSGNGNDAATLARGTAVRPTIAAAAQNGHDAVDFGDGVTVKGLDLNGFTAPEGDWTIIAVVYVDTPDTTRYSIFASESTAGEEFIFGISNDAYAFYFDSDRQGDAWEPGWQVLTLRLRKTDAYFNTGAIWRQLELVCGDVYGTGGSSEKASIANNTSLGCNKGGTGETWDGMIGELMIFDRGLLPHEIRGLVQYARNKWAI